MNRKFLKALVGVGAIGLTAALASAQPANDDCSMPTILAIGANSGDTTGATGTDISSCAFNDALDVWFTFTAPSAGNYTFNTIGTTVDTVLSAWDGCAGAQIICNDDGAGFPASLISLNLATNQVATIRLAGYNNSQGVYVINVIAPPPPPANDTCATAEAVALPYNYSQVVGGALEDLDVSCNDGAAAATNNGVWFTYTPAANQLVRFTESTTANVVIAIFAGGCAGLSEVRCSDAEDFAQPLVGGTTYHIMVGAFGATPFGATTSINFSMSDVAPVANDTCADAVVVAALPFAATVDAFGAQEDIDLSCNAAAATATQNGIWFSYTPAASQLVRIAETGTANTVIGIYTGGCGGLSEVYCSDPEDFVRTLNAGTTYHFLVGGQGAAPIAGTALFQFALSEVQAPSNDTCADAVVVAALPFAATVDAFGAQEDIDLSCNAAAATATQNGIWFSYTPAANQLVRIAETGTANTVIGIFTGGCGGLSEDYCSDPEDFVRTLNAGTTYHFLVGGQGAAPVAGTALFQFALSEVQAPTNDNCATARTISGSPYIDTVDISTATNDIDVGCNAAANTETRNGVWYRLDTGADPGQLILRDTSANDVVFAIFTGGCDGLSEVFCSDAEAPAPAFAAAANTTYYILVGMWSSTTVPTAPFAIQVDFVLATGSCCVGSNCTITTQSACTGTWGGVGSNCGGATGFNFVQGTNAYEDISGTGTVAVTASGCDDCGQTVPIGFSFSFLGNSYSTVWICSNGFIQFGGGNSTVFTNAPIPTAGLPNNFIAPFWDDLNPGVAGDVYYRLSGTPGSQTFTVSWQNVTQFALTTDESFQVILTEGTNGIEFRYGTITAETPAGDYTVGYESSDGLSGGSFPGASLGSGGLSLALSNANPCSTGGGDGACCSGSNCSVTSQAACTGFGTFFTGSNTVCNVFGVNNLTPCCKADFNHAGGITVQDIFDFLNGYFTVNPQADVNGSGSVTVQDIFDYLSLYFVGGC